MTSDNRNDQDRPMPYSGRGGGRSRQGIGEAFMMSLVRQIARSIGTLLMRMITGGWRPPRDTASQRQPADQMTRARRSGGAGG